MLRHYWARARLSHLERSSEASDARAGVYTSFGTGSVERRNNETPGVVGRRFRAGRAADPIPILRDIRPLGLQAMDGTRSR